MERTATLNRRQLDKVERKYDDDVYINNSTFSCAKLAIGCSIESCARIMVGDCAHALAAVRPPGHHVGGNGCCAKRAAGFCFFNSVATCAKLASKGELICADGRRADPIDKILIVDFDVHHGNGTQALCWDDPKIMYFSVHRGFESKSQWKQRTFYPGTGKAREVGGPNARGTIINCPWSEPGMGDREYLACWHRLLLPIAREFAPELILISAGFDAARGDPLGGCDVSNQTFGHLVKPLTELANVCLVLEGGYNLQNLGQAFSSCARVLLGLSADEEGSEVISYQGECHPQALEDIFEAVHVHTRYWPTLAQANADMVDRFDALANNFGSVVIIEQTDEAPVRKFASKVKTRRRAAQEATTADLSDFSPTTTPAVSRPPSDDGDIQDIPSDKSYHASETVVIPAQQQNDLNDND
mmetsp:Transcript_4712/g.5824  ORF Transcript_4712/g.5824 Transcript_4712/m.5824 type:complete len:415 (+) Transcript_4712:359-1603(+)